MGRYGLLQEISSHTASRQSQGQHRVRLCLARLRCAHASVVFNQQAKTEGEQKAQTLDAAKTLQSNIVLRHFQTRHV